ncbi:hypothetical protein BGX24_000110 [Mortierella sp. AD032]|nr:hypothetical protein BGX24_000110 [Mortierella sp. AD032]
MATATATTNPHQRHYGAVKSAIMKTPIARARAREAKGPRKVIFGDMITIVTIDRPDSPPPAPLSPGSEKEKKKAAAALAKKKKSKKNGNQAGPHPDPEYDEDYYSIPYTPIPAEVLVTQAPWIGNPNYDEEKQNSKFYYDDDASAEYEYDDYEYEAPFDIRSGPGDEDEEDEEEYEEDEEEDEGAGSRAWGNGIVGGGVGAQVKKKASGGGMFKFKKAVNRLLRN